jgi:hypothetical protein
LLSREGLLLFTLCTLDMVSSAWLFHAGLAVEANPLLRPFADAGVSQFVLVKCLTYVPAVAYVEWLRRSRPRFAVNLLRWAAVGYTALYAGPTFALLLAA